MGKYGESVDDRILHECVAWMN